jgi:hypothetical protein
MVWNGAASCRGRPMMATLPEAYDKQLFRSLGARAVWLPGETVLLGDVVVRRNGRFNKVAHINSFGAQMQTLSHSDTSLDLSSTSVSQTIFQAGVQLSDTSKLDLSADASVKLEFTGKSQFLLKTPTLSGGSIQNMLEIAGKVAGQANWQHDKFFIVHELYTAVDWSFLGTKEKSAAVEFSGKGAAVLSFLSAGVTFGLKSSGAIEVKILGKGGAIAQNVARVKRDGELLFDV